MARFLQRYLIAAAVFALSAAWLGLGIVRAFECLAMFLLTSALLLLHHRRRALADRRLDSRARGRGHDRARRDQRSARSAPRTRLGSTDEADWSEWPHAAEHGW